MARVSRQVRLFRQLISKLEPTLRAAFAKVEADLRENVNLSDFQAALTSMDIDAAVKALNIEPAAFEAYRAAVNAIYAEAGSLAVKTINLPRGAPKVRFDMLSPEVSDWMKKNVADRIIEKSIPETVEAVRKTITDGYAAGRHPNTIARDIAGRTVNGRREGGVLGLSPSYAAHVESMRARLNSGDPVELQKVLTMMSKRDKRYDKKIKDAIAGRSKLTQEQISAMAGSYSDRLKKLRARTVARTETGMAVMGSREEAMAQTIDKLGLSVDALIKTWIHGGGVDDPRPHHQALNGTSIRGLNSTFTVGSAQMKHALDPSGGAKECANCTCDTEFRIDHMWGL